MDRIEIIGLYENALLRAPEAEAIEFWLDIAAEQGAGFVTDAIANSQESVELRTVTLPIIGLYQGLLGRAPEPAGLAFWSAAIKQGQATFADLIAGFTNSPEFKTAHPELADAASAEQLIELFYENFLGRAPDAGGQTFYLDLFAKGQLTPELFARSFLLSPEFQSEYGDELRAYIDDVRDGVINDPRNGGSLTDLDGNTGGDNGGDNGEPDGGNGGGGSDGNGDGDGDGDGDGGNPTPSFTLTTATEEAFIGTDANETFNAIIGTGATLNDSDSVSGGGGIDTMNLTVDGAYTFPDNASVSNVENINFIIEDGSSGTISALDFVGATTFSFKYGVLDIEGLTGEQEVTFNNDVGMVVYNDATTSATIALSGVDSNQVLEVGGLKLTSLTIEGSVASNFNEPGQIDVTPFLGESYTEDDDTRLETLIINLTSDTSVGLDNLLTTTSFTSIDASGSSGNISIAFTERGHHVSSIQTGSGNDDIGGAGRYYFDNDIGKVTIDAGGGNDVVTLDDEVGGSTNNVEVSITLGAGRDTAKFIFLQNIYDASSENLASSLTVIEDFDPLEDTIDFRSVTALLQTDLDDNQKLAIASEDTLFGAVTIASSLSADRELDFVAFDYKGDAYLYYDYDDSETPSAGDGLIRLVGVEVADLNANNFLVPFERL